MSEMFQQRKWKHGIVQREGRDLRITVPPRGGFGDAVMLAIIALFMAFGVLAITVPPMLRAVSLLDSLGKASPAIIFGLPWFFMFRWAFERDFAEQVVAVRAGRITWIRKTKWWTRNHDVNLGEVSDISASTGWSGLGRVDITAKGRRRTILDTVLNDDAVRFARQVKGTAGIQ